MFPVQGRPWQQFTSTVGLIKKTTKVGGYRTSHSSQGERAAVTSLLLQEAPAQRQSFTLDYSTDLEEIQKAHQELSKNTHTSCV